MRSSTPVQCTATLLFAALIAFVSSGQAIARDVTRSGSYVTGKGRTGSYSSQVSGHRRDGLIRSQTITTNSGRTLNQAATTTYDRQTGTFDRSVTGVNGRTRTLTGTARDGQRRGTYTTATGKSGTFASDVKRGTDGILKRNLSVTNQDGKTYNRSATYAYDRPTKTIVRSVTGPGENTRTGSVTFIPDQP